MIDRNQPQPPIRIAEPGAWLMAAASAIGLLTALVDYFSRGNGIAYTPGVLLVVVASALLLAASLLLAADALRVGLTITFVTLAALDILGAGFAAWLLEANWILGLMIVAGVGWIVNVFVDAPAELAARIHSPRLQESIR